jgi:hypothetical protein
VSNLGSVGVDWVRSSNSYLEAVFFKFTFKDGLVQHVGIVKFYPVAYMECATNLWNVNVYQAGQEYCVKHVSYL